jgi:adenylate cyclase
MIGDTTNFASRLEALNKYLGTELLISESTRAQLGDLFLVRPLGEFRTAGKAHSVVIHELICRCDQETDQRPWIQVFEQALDQMRAGDIPAARRSLEQTQELRGGRDGPSAFYLETIARLEKAGRIEGWTGLVEMTEK